MASIQQILQPITLTKVISRQMAAEKWILQFLGMQPGGANEQNYGHGRSGTYQVFNRSRQVAKGRAPGTAAAISKRQKVGDVPIVYPRMHEEIPLPAEELHNLAQIGDPTTRDAAGTAMITRQTRFAAERAANWRVAQAVGMLRDDLYWHVDGDDWYINFTSTSANFQQNFNMPAGNKSQLDMLGAGDIIDVSWDNPAANIPKMLGEIDAAFQQLYGGQLKNVLVRNAVWQNIITNDQVANQAGIANTPFRQFERVVGTKEDGSPLGVSVGELSCRPGVTFWITDEGLSIGAPGSETFTPYIPTNNAIFLNDPSVPDIYSFQLGSEPISEYDGQPATVRFGYSAWSKMSANPTATEIFSLDNGLAINHIPNSTCNATVVF